MIGFLNTTNNFTRIFLVPSRPMPTWKKETDGSQFRGISTKRSIRYAERARF